jgi:spore maturation protein SpmA
MALNYIWVAFFLIAFVVSLVQWIVFQDNTIFERVMSASFDSAKNAVMVIALPLAGIMTLWLGILNIGEKAGAIRFLSRIVGPFFSKLFPEIPKNHPAGGQLLMNFSATMLGLDNAATPMGLKAMQSLQELNPDKDTASNAQIMFLALNTAGMTIIPINIIAQRAIMGSANPTDVFIPILIATFVATLSAILFVGVRQKLNLLNRTVLGWIGGITFLLGSLVWWFSTMSREEMANASSILSNVTIFGIIVTFICGALYKKINVWEAFIDGAKGGFETSVKIIPYLVGMLVGVAVFRASGAMELVTDGIKFIISSIGLNVDFVDALPTAFMKPLSGSGARGMMLDTMKTYGADSFVGHLSCLFQGAADTTFYIVALYFGSVGIKRTRYAIWAGLLADAAGALAAIFLAYAFFK